MLAWLKNITPEELPTNSVPSFVLGQVQMGDVLYTPLGFYFLEKAVNADSLAVKASWRVWEPYADAESKLY